MSKDQPPVAKKPTKITGRARERIVDEMEATLDAVRAEMELLGPLVRGRNPSAAKLFLALDRMSRETRDLLFAMEDAKNATQH